MNFEDFLSDKEFLKNGVSSIALFLAVYGIRFFAGRSIQKSKTIPREHRRQWIVKTKTLSLFVLFLGLLVIWASELQAFAVSLVAVAAAIVLATKEIIMNISGYFARASAKPFSVGDRIEVSGVRGDVVDQNLFFTKILEIGPGKVTNQYTGRSVNIPNSVFLQQNIINESFTDTFTLHVFQIPVLISKDLLVLREELLKQSSEICKEYIEPAQKAFKALEKNQAFETPSVEPRVYLHFVDKETAEFVVRIPAPTSRKGRVEQEIIQAFSKKFVETLV